MKTILRKTALLALFIMIAFGLSAARSLEYTREIKKDFQVNPDAKLILENKFGDVQIFNWEKNEISIIVKITVEARSLESATELFEKVKINFSGNATQVEARTQLLDNVNSKGRFQIDYVVNMPASLSVDINNSFGDLIIPEIAGKATIRLGYGNAEINKLSNSDNFVEIKFGNADIDWIKGAVMNLKYSNFEGDYAGSLNLNSSYSNFTANKVIVLETVFEGGKLDLDESSVLNCRSKFSDISLGKLDQKIDLDNQYGSFTIDDIPCTFFSIVVSNNFGNIELGLQDGCDYKLDAEMSFCNLDYDDDRGDFSYREDSGHKESIHGIIGKNPTSSVKVTSNYGNVSLD